MATNSWSTVSTFQPTCGVRRTLGSARKGLEAGASAGTDPIHYPPSVLFAVFCLLSRQVSVSRLCRGRASPILRFSYHSVERRAEQKESILSEAIASRPRSEGKKRVLGELILGETVLEG